MGRNNGHGRAPQRSRLIADREERQSRANLAFAMYRPVAAETTEEIYSRLRPLQQEEDIPGCVRLFDHDLHSSIVQERRMRKGLVMGFAAGFAVSSALGHLESSLPGHGRSHIKAEVKGVSLIGRNRNTITAQITDEAGVLPTSRQTVWHILGSMGLNMNIDRKDHITLGTSKGGITQTESRHIQHTVAEVLQDVPILLEPVVIEYNGQRLPLSEAKMHITD